MTAEERAFYRALGQLIRECRKRTPLTQDKLATSLGLSRTTVTNIEAGGQMLAVHEFLEIARILKVPLEELLPGNTTASPDLTRLRGAQRQWVKDVLSPSEKDDPENAEKTTLRPRQTKGRRAASVRKGP